MAKGDKEILQQFVDAIVPALKEVSGSFGDTIESEVTDDGFEITASPFINVLVDGRAPTSTGATKGSPTLQETILSWIESKSITARATTKGVIPTSEQLSWAISKSIHMHGTVLYRQGGGNNIFDPIITQKRIDNLLNLLGDKYFTEVISISKTIES